MGAGLRQTYARRLSSRDTSGKWRIDDMYFSIHKQALWGMVVGAIAISGASACSRSDRAGTGRDTTQSGAVTSAPTDTGTQASTQPAGDTALPSTGDTTTTAAAPSKASKRADGVSGDTSVSSAASDTASAEMAGAANASDSAGAAGEQALTADTAGVDTTTAGYSEMARDTSSTAAPGDTATVAISDSGTVQVQMDTSTAQAPADTAAVSTDSLAVASTDSADTTTAQSEQVAVQGANGGADTLQGNAGRIRPPEDSTEVLGNVTTDSATVATGEAADQSQAEPIRPPEDSTEIAGNVTRDENGADVSSREVPTEASGAAAMGHPVTGIDAVAVMSRAGVRCVVKDDATEVWWDMADSPSALNPCGTGTMTLSLVKSGEK
jgi:hypothetical protein